MGEYSHQGQSRELSDAIRKAQGGHSGRTKYALVGATLLAAGGLLAGGLALADSGDVPPHEERVAYFLKNYSDVWFEMDHGPEFEEAHAWSSLRDHFWVYVAHPKRPGEQSRQAIGIVDGADREDPADGTPDWAFADIPSGRQVNYCVAEYRLLPGGIQEMLMEHYVLGSEGFYRHVTEGLNRYEGNIGEAEFQEFWTACKELNERN